MSTQGDDQSWVARALCASIEPDVLFVQGASQRQVRMRVEGQLVFNNIALRLTSALAGMGLAYLPEDQVLEPVAEGRLIRVLEDWCEPFPGYYLYYPSRRHASPAFAVLVDALRYRG